jgi:hypothetical protein
MQEATLTDAQKEALPPEEIEKFEQNEKEKAENLQKIEEELEKEKELDAKNAERVKELLEMAKRSVDEEREKKHFNDKVYKKDFIPDKESTNCVPAIMSAMVS